MKSTDKAPVAATTASDKTATVDTTNTAAVKDPYEGKTTEQIEAIKALNDLQAKKKEMEAQLKTLKAQAKGQIVKPEAKGVFVTFTNKAGETITGKGVRYYVVRQGGKLHYKQEDQVKLLSPEEIAALPKNDELAS